MLSPQRAMTALIAMSFSSVVLAQETWEEFNEPGFGDPARQATQAAAMLDLRLFVSGTGSGAIPQAQIFSRHVDDEDAWQIASPDDPRWNAVTRVNAIVPYRGRLIVATKSFDDGEIWISEGEKLDGRPPAAFTANRWIDDLAVFRGRLYAAYGNGVRVYRLPVDRSGNIGPSELAMEGAAGTLPPGFGRDPDVAFSAKLYAYQDRMYLGIGAQSPGGDRDLADAAQIWEYDGENWVHLTEGNHGFGVRGNNSIPSMMGYRGHIYAGTVNHNGAEIWRTPVRRTSPVVWENVTPQAWDPGGPFATFRIVRVASMLRSGNRIFVGTRGSGDGIWVTRFPETRDSWTTTGRGELPASTDIVSTLTDDYPFVYATIWNAGGDGMSVYRLTPSSARTGEVCGEIGGRIAQIDVEVADLRAIATEPGVATDIKEDAMRRANELEAEKAEKQALRERLGCP